MSTSSFGIRLLRVSESGVLGGRSHAASTPCSPSLLRSALRQHHARHRQHQQLHTSASGSSSAIGSSEGNIASRARWSGNSGWSSGSSRSGRRQGQHHSSGSRSSPRSPPRPAWLLTPLSLSRIRLDDSANNDPTMVEMAQDFYEHAKDLTLNEKASLLEEGEQLSLWDRFLTSIHRWIIEPLGTARRFLYLAILFLPVIVTAPILALELLDDKTSPPSSRRRKRKYQERTTTRWWYRFLVRQMERAGPTFIKVSILFSYSILSLQPG